MNLSNGQREKDIPGDMSRGIKAQESMVCTGENKLGKRVALSRACEIKLVCISAPQLLWLLFNVAKPWFLFCKMGIIVMPT